MRLTGKRNDAVPRGCDGTLDSVSENSKAKHETIPFKVNITSGLVVHSAMAVHTVLGPGLLESTYERCFVHELRKHGAQVESQVELPIHYGGVKIEPGYRIDMLVNDEVIVEVKAVAQLHPIHRAQLMTYLKLSGRRVGLLINFNVPHLKDGIVRIVR